MYCSRIIFWTRYNFQVWHRYEMNGRFNMNTNSKELNIEVTWNIVRDRKASESEIKWEMHMRKTRVYVHYKKHDRWMRSRIKLLYNFDHRFVSVAGRTNWTYVMAAVWQSQRGWLNELPSDRLIRNRRMNPGEILVTHSRIAAAILGMEWPCKQGNY